MAMHRDMMPHFELYQPDSVQGARSRARHRSAWFVAAAMIRSTGSRTATSVPVPSSIWRASRSCTAFGGRCRRPEIGALTKLVDVEHSHVVRARYSLLATAAGRVASPRSAIAVPSRPSVPGRALLVLPLRRVSCYRAGGAPVTRIHRMICEHCLFGASRCVAVSLGTATASIALDAHGAPGSGRRAGRDRGTVLHSVPAHDITRMTCLQPGELLVAVRFRRSGRVPSFVHFEGRRPQHLGLRSGQRCCGPGCEGRPHHPGATGVRRSGVRPRLLPSVNGR